MTNCPPANKLHGAARRNQNVRVLLVEDNPGDARLIRELLCQTNRPCVVDHVTNLAGALNDLNDRPADVVLLDLSLPDARGIDAVRELHRAHANTPIVVLTGQDDEQLGIAAVQAGAQDYLVKGSVIVEGCLFRAVLYAVERKRTQAIEQERRTLRDTVQSLQEVLGIVGHELRTPLAAVRAMLELIAGSDEITLEQQHRYMSLMQEEIERMANLISQLLDSARYNNCASQWNWSSFDFARVCSDAIDAVRLSSPASNVTIRCDVDPPNLTVRGDSQALRRLIINLLSNAIRHTAEGTIELDARRRADQGIEWVELTVRDNGEGIPPEILQRLGRAFPCRGVGVRHERKRGAGLGLAICRGIADAHGGGISVASTVNEGTRFTALLRSDLPKPVIRAPGSNPKPIAVVAGEGATLNTAA